MYVSCVHLYSSVNTQMCTVSISAAQFWYLLPGLAFGEDGVTAVKLCNRRYRSLQQHHPRKRPPHRLPECVIPQFVDKADGIPRGVDGDTSAAASAPAKETTAAPTQKQSAPSGWSFFGAKPDKPSSSLAVSKPETIVVRTPPFTHVDL